LRRAFTLILFVVLGVSFGARAQEQPICYERPTYVDDTWTDGTRWCLEQVIEDADAGQLGFTALAAAPDGTLYAARPLTGQVFALTDGDGDGLPESPQVAAEGLTLPNGLAYDDGSLYISGGANLYRLRDGDVTTLVDDLPSGAGFWTGDVAVGPDRRLYVATGAPCDACIPDDAGRGAVLSFDMNGGDRQIVATGLREPVGLAFAGGVLWTVDTARDGLRGTPDLDELNRVEKGANFGFPYCVGADNALDIEGGDCGGVTAPALTFPTHSNPLGMAAYEGEAFPDLKGDLLVVLGGSNNEAFMEGYALAQVSLDEAGNPMGYDLLIPGQSPSDPERFSLQHMNYRTSGFWPRRPLDVTVNAEGWIYVSAGDGRILALRPL
jgi:glucose/arabinose dehydrogenase